VWIPILDITDELEALDLSAELEQLELDTARAEFDDELHALERDFWSTAPRRLEEAVARIRQLPVPIPPPVAAPVEEPIALAAAEPAVEIAPETETASGPAAPRARTTLIGVDRRVVGTVLLVAVLAAFAAVSPSVVGASAPQRDITITLDGRTFNRTVRASDVGEVLRTEGITLAPGDQVRPSLDAALRTGMPIQVLRAFPVDVDVDGTVTTVRTVLRSPVWLRRDLKIGAGLIIAAAPRVLSAGTRVAFRTPHDATLQVDGRTIVAPRSGALDVSALLTANHVTLGPRDEVTPPPATRLTNGMNVRVFRLAAGEIAEQVTVPFTTETRDDPNLAVGQTRVIQLGSPGVQRSLFRIVTRDDGTLLAKLPTGSELLVPPVSQVIVRGTQPISPRARGSATHYETGPGPGTCAHLTLRLGTMVTLTNPATGAVARCRVADRGPAAWTGHIIDLAPDVFRRLAPLSQGVVQVNLSY
jgi:uncharacterized protein YabE (DUF348 family)